MSTYALSRDLRIPPIAGICTALQIKSFAKWSKSNYIIKDHKNLINTLEGKVENQRRHCWYLFFHEYNFRLIYRQGRKNEKQNS